MAGGSAAHTGALPADSTGLTTGFFAVPVAGAFGRGFSDGGTGWSVVVAGSATIVGAADFTPRVPSSDRSIELITGSAACCSSCVGSCAIGACSETSWLTRICKPLWVNSRDTAAAGQDRTSGGGPDWAIAGVASSRPAR